MNCEKRLSVRFMRINRSRRQYFIRLPAIVPLQTNIMPEKVSSKVMLLPGFQKGRDIKASQGQGQGAVLAQKRAFASYKEKL
jgi:hypothetical protein